MRYCLDFRLLNSKTRFDAEPIPNQEILLGKLGKARYCTKIDLSKGYWQVPIRPGDRHLTAFRTPEEGLLQFAYMPFGLVNAGAVFCRMVRKLLAGVSNVESYIDDIVVHNENWDSHLETIREVFQRLRQHHLTVRPTKCTVGENQIELLGHIVGDGLIKPQEGKVEKIMNIQQPSTKKQLRAFLGSVGYYQKFIENYATVAKHLTDLTKAGNKSRVYLHLIYHPLRSQVQNLQLKLREYHAKARAQEQEEQGLEKLKIYCHKDIFPQKYWKDFNSRKICHFF